MRLYECNFKDLEEKLLEDDEESPASPLGGFLCKLLSPDYEKISSDIGSFLIDNKLSGKEFPVDDLQKTVEDLCFTAEFDEIRDMASMLRILYNAGETQEVVNVYGELKEAFVTESFECFKIAFILQIYLEESENRPNMFRADNFERFVNSGLEMHIRRNEQAASLSEYNLLSDIYPGCEAREIITDVFDNMQQFDDDFSIFALDSLDRLLVSSIYYFLLNGFIFKRCKNCGRFFVPLSRSDEIYCNMISPQDSARTCKEYGSQKLWYDRVKNDEVAKLSRNIYSAKQMLVRRNPNIFGYKEMFEYFKAERKKWESLIKSGKKSKEEYIDWLNEMKAKKTL